jgi:hypothetical protein
LRIAVQFDANVGHERYPIIDCSDDQSLEESISNNPIAQAV